MDKIAVCPAAAGKGDVRKCPYASKFFNHEKVPYFLGGQMQADQLGVNLRGDNVDGPAEGDDNDKMQASQEWDSAIAARDKTYHTFEVPLGDLYVDWILNITNGHGISMCAVLEGEDGEQVILRPDEGKPGQLKAEGGLVKGSWLIEKPGTVVVTLDNSFSRLRSKQVKLSLALRSKED